MHDPTHNMHTTTLLHLHVVGNQRPTSRIQKLERVTVRGTMAATSNASRILHNRIPTKVSIVLRWLLYESTRLRPELSHVSFSGGSLVRLCCAASTDQALLSPQSKYSICLILTDNSGRETRILVGITASRVAFICCSPGQSVKLVVYGPRLLAPKRQSAVEEGKVTIIHRYDSL